MVEVGKLEISGSIQTRDLENGFNRLESGLDEVGSKANSVNSDFERMSSHASGLAMKMGVLALAGGGAMVAMAKGSPAVAGAMAKIRVATGELGRSLGRILKPAFDSAAEGFGKFVDWVRENEGGIRSFVDVVLTPFAGTLNAIGDAGKWAMDGVDSLKKSLTGMETGVDWEGLFSKVGGSGLAGLLTKLGLSKIPGLSKFAGPAGGAVYGGTMLASGGEWTQTAGMAGFAMGLPFGGVGAIAGTGIGVTIGAIIDAVLNKEANKQEVEYMT